MLKSYLPEFIRLPNGTILYPVIGGCLKQQPFTTATSREVIAAEAKRGFASKVGLFGDFWGKLQFCPKNHFDVLRRTESERHQMHFVLGHHRRRTTSRSLNSSIGSILER